jgi:hypothetical protein
MLPILRYFLPVDHFHHFAVLVTAINILLSEPTHKDMDIAHVLLQYFVKEMESLYGARAMTINIHSLCHLAKQVKESGPLWSKSMLAFENMVKEIGHLYSGTRYIGDQITERFQCRQQLSRCHLASSKVVDEFSVHLWLRRHRSLRNNTVTVADNIDYFSMLQAPLERLEQDAIFRHTGVQHIRCTTATRVIIHGEVFHSSAYKKKGTSCSNIVQVATDTDTTYGRIIKFVLCNSTPMALVKLIHVHNMNICNDSPRASQAFLRELARDSQLASHYLFASGRLR